MPYPEYATPLSRQLVTQYAIFFQERFVPKRGRDDVSYAEQIAYRIQAWVEQRRVISCVIAAVGMDYIAYIPKKKVAGHL
jgi:hypothetical protein